MPAHHEPTMPPECLLRACVCVCAPSAVHCIRDKEGGEYLCVCVCLGFSIVGGLGWSQHFPAVRRFCGRGFGWTRSNKERSFPPDMQMSSGGRG